MTELTITPKTADKTARFRGAVAAGEHVAVTIKGGAAWLGDGNGEHLSLRVLDLVTGRTLAVFPRPPETYEDGAEPEEQDEWERAGEDDADLFCNLNLNTDRMVNAARHMLRVPVLFVLGEKDEDNPATTRTLYFRDRYIVEYWPERIGDDTPYDLDKWPKQIDEWTQLVEDWSARLDRMKLAAQRTGDEPTEEVPYTMITLNKGVEGETDTVVKVYDGQDGQDGQDGETTHEWVEERFLPLAGGEMSGPIEFPVSGDGQSISASQGGIVVTDGTKTYEFTQNGVTPGDSTVARLSDVATKQNTLTFDSAPTANSTNPVTSGGVKTAIDAVAGDVADINDLIPSAASSSNQIADKAFVNSSIATNTANYISDNGEPFESVTALNAYSGTKTNNDYAFVVGEDSAGNTTYTRYKWTGSAWAAEYVLNNSSFTSAQWAAITSGITSSAVTKLAGIAAGAQVNVIETVKVNGTTLTPSSKAVNIEIVQAQADWNETSSSSSSFIKNKPTVPELLPVYGDNPLMDGTASPGTGTAYALGNHRHPTDTSRQPSITASGILKGNGSGGVSAAVPGTDYQAPLTIDETPTASSANPVQSGGVKTALDGKVSGALGSGGWRVTNGQRDYVFASDTMADDESTIARIGDLRYPKHTLTTPAGAATLLDRAVNKYTGDSTFTSCTFTLPPAIDGQVRDFLLDMDNSSNASDVAAEFYGLGTDYALAVNADDVLSSKTAGEVLAEMTVVEAGTRARLYFTETALVSNGLPVISIQRITLGAVATAITRGS